MSLKIKGLDAMQKKLNDLANRAKSLDGTQQIPVNELLTPAFISKYSNFSSAQEFFDASKIESLEGLEENSEWNQFVKENSSFESWQEMLNQAGVEWVQEKLGLN